MSHPAFSSELADVNSRFQTGTPEDRAALFDSLVATTMRRTAFSPHKIRAIGPAGIGYRDMGAYVRDEMERHRDELVAADDPDRLYYVLRKISNARWDAHLQPGFVEGGIVLETPLLETPLEVFPHAPIKFRPDLSSAADPFLFVSDFARNITDWSDGVAPEVGDRLLGINGEPIDRYVTELGPFHGASTWAAKWWEIAWSIPMKLYSIPPRFYEPLAIAFELERSTGVRYRLTVPYMTHASVEWNGYDDHYLKYQRRPTPSLDEPRYTGFHRVLATQTFDAYRSPTWPVLILRWFRFGDSTQDDVRRLLRFADGEGLLDYSIVWDGTRSLGGTFGAWVLQRLQPQPFRMTFGNVRISDVTPALTQQLRATAIYRLQAAPPADQRPAGPIHEIDGGGFLLAWLDEDLSQAIAAGEEYSTSVPFKSYFLPKDADGTVHPAPVHFRGPMAILLSPHGCSHVDQFAAMFIDNGLGHSVGMPAGGCSNTWEWTEVLRFPRTGEPVMAYSWTVGQTLRPNGEVLEGNPAQVRHYLPLTRDNYLTYYDELLESALAWIKRARDGEGRR